MVGFSGIYAVGLPHHNLLVCTHLSTCSDGIPQFICLTIYEVELDEATKCHCKNEAVENVQTPLVWRAEWFVYKSV